MRIPYWLRLLCLIEEKSGSAKKTRRTIPESISSGGARGWQGVLHPQSELLSPPVGKYTSKSLILSEQDFATVCKVFKKKKG